MMYKALEIQAAVNKLHLMIVYRCELLFQALVFVVGGGNYIEYQNLVDYAKVCIHLCIGWLK